jgi:hypothetical protein
MATSTSKPTPESYEQRIARLKREHADTVAKLKAEGDARVKAVYDRHAQNLEEWDLRQQFRREEERIRRQNEDALDLAYRRTGRDHRKYLGLPMSLKDAQDKLADVIETHRIYADDPQVVLLREWLMALAAQHRIDVREDAAPQLRNGSAVRKLRRVTIAPIQSLETAAVAAHEIGHILGDSDPNAPSKRGEFGLGTICVSDELKSWEWVLENIPLWQAPMHERMTECLASYRPHATPVEANAMDGLCADLTFRRVQLRIMTGEKK